MLYLPYSKFSCYSNCSEDGGCSGYWYSSEGSTSTHDRNAKTSPAYTHTCKQEQTKLSYNYSTRYNDRVSARTNKNGAINKKIYTVS